MSDASPPDADMELGAARHLRAQLANADNERQQFVPPFDNWGAYQAGSLSGTLGSAKLIHGLGLTGLAEVDSVTITYVDGAGEESSEEERSGHSLRNGYRPILLKDGSDGVR